MLASPRYHVTTVGGDLEPRVGGTAHAAGLSAHVIDRPNAHKVVATFCSEDRTYVQDERGRMLGCVTLGQQGALDAARALADEWNADEAR